MEKINATDFKARCLELMDRVRERGETYLITKRGRGVAKLAPVDRLPEGGGVLGCLRGEMTIAGDILGSPAAAAPWGDALREWDELNAPAAAKPRRTARRRR